MMARHRRRIFSGILGGGLVVIVLVSLGIGHREGGKGGCYVIQPATPALVKGRLMHVSGHDSCPATGYRAWLPEGMVGPQRYGCAVIGAVPYHFAARPPAVEGSSEQFRGDHIADVRKEALRDGAIIPLTARFLNGALSVTAPDGSAVTVLGGMPQ